MTAADTAPARDWRPTAGLLLALALPLVPLGRWIAPVEALPALLALLYAWRRDTPSNMIAHFLTDAAGFLAS